MDHTLADLARERHRRMLMTAAREGDSRRARRHGRISRRAERADRRLASDWSQAARLRADLSRLESAG